MSNILILISLFLDGYLSFFLPIKEYSFFIPLCTLTALVICYPFIKRKYLIAFIVGIIYDLMYTNMLVLTSSLFIISYYFLSKINTITKKKAVDDLIKLSLVIITYKLITYFFTCILFNKDFYFKNIVYSILCSLIFNLFYGLLLGSILKNKS